MARSATPLRAYSHWSGLGLNYYGATVTIVDTDLAYLRNHFPRLRPHYPLYSANTSHRQYICIKAKELGFYVVWGVTTPTPCDAAEWELFKAAVLNFAEIAQQIGIDEFSLGNEHELHVDGTTISPATVRSDMRALAADVKQIFSGTVSYQADQEQTENWAAEGIGALDRIGFNIYSEYPQHIANIVAIGTDRAYISEFNLNNGFFTNFVKSSEDVFAHAVMDRLRLIRAAGIHSAYFYTYQYDTPGKWELKLGNGSYRKAFWPLVGTRQPTPSRGPSPQRASL